MLKYFDEVDDFGARLDARWAAQPGDQGARVSAVRWQELEAEVAKIVKVRCCSFVSCPGYYHQATRAVLSRTGQGGGGPL